MLRYALHCMARHCFAPHCIASAAQRIPLVGVAPGSSFPLGIESICEGPEVGIGLWGQELRMAALCQVVTTQEVGKQMRNTPPLPPLTSPSLALLIVWATHSQT